MSPAKRKVVRPGAQHASDYALPSSSLPRFAAVITPTSGNNGGIADFLSACLTITRGRVRPRCRLRARAACYFVTRSTGVSTTPDRSDCFLCSESAFSATSMPNTACFAAYWSAVASTRPSFSIGLIALMLS
jgi:hypothetical protein